MPCFPDAQLGGDEGGRRPPLPFFRNREKCPDFGKRGSHFIHLCVKFSIQNVVLKGSRRKNSKILLAVPFLTIFVEVPKLSWPCLVCRRKINILYHRAYYLFNMGSQWILGSSPNIINKIYSKKTSFLVQWRFNE